MTWHGQMAKEISRDLEWQAFQHFDPPMTSTSTRIPAHLWRPICTPRRTLTDGARRYRRRLAILERRKKTTLHFRIRIDF